MKNLLISAVVVFLSALLIPSVNAGPNDPNLLRNGKGQVHKKGGHGGKSGQITPRKPGSSLNEEYQKRRAAKKRAAEMRKQQIIREGGEQSQQPAN